MPRPSTIRSRRRGSSVVEFALVAPVLFAILFGVMEYGWYMSQRIAIVSAARDAMRAASTTPQDSLVPPEEVAYKILAERLDSYGYTGTAYTSAWRDGEAPSQMFSVWVYIPYRPIFGLVPTPTHVWSYDITRMEDQPDA